MGYQKCFLVISLVCFGCIAIEAIKVDFGTRKGPIIPPTSTTKRPEPRNLFIPVPRVWEIQEDDAPTPKPYRPFLPYQYRTKVYNYQKVPSQIYVGTEYDRKYAPENLKNARLFYPNNNNIAARSLNLAPTIAVPSQQTNYDNNAAPQQRKYVTRQNGDQPTQQTYYEDKTTTRQTNYDNSGASSSAPKTTGTPGLAYRGPQTFGPEHFNPVPAKYPIQYYAKYARNERNGVVPEFGIVYSSGVRYYVPRVDLSEGGHENSVYDEQDAKY